MKYALIELKESETINVGEVLLFDDEEAAVQAGIEKYDAEDCELDGYDRYVDPMSGEVVFAVRPVTG